MTFMYPLSVVESALEGTGPGRSVDIALNNLATDKETGGAAVVRSTATGGSGAAAEAQRGGVAAQRGGAVVEAKRGGVAAEKGGAAAEAKRGGITAERGGAAAEAETIEGFIIL